MLECSGSPPCAFDGCLEIRVLFEGPDVLKLLTTLCVLHNNDDIGATQVEISESGVGRQLFDQSLDMSLWVNENLDRDTMNTWTTKAPIRAIMSQLFNHTRYKKDIFLELLTVGTG
nr:hypothetical protein [Tanacetum cinerariifolium]